MMSVGHDDTVTRRGLLLCRVEGIALENFTNNLQKYIPSHVYSIAILALFRQSFFMSNSLLGFVTGFSSKEQAN